LLQKIFEAEKYVKLTELPISVRNQLAIDDLFKDQVLLLEEIKRGDFNDANTQQKALQFKENNDKITGEYEGLLYQEANFAKFDDIRVQTSKIRMLIPEQNPIKDFLFLGD